MKIMLTDLGAKPTGKTAAGVATTCPYCGVGCGVIATPLADGSVTVRGDESHPANAGKLCVKGSALGETGGPDGRLLTPMMRAAGAPGAADAVAVAGETMRPVSWDTALDAVATGLAGIIERHGPDAVALYVSGQLLTEDYYIANKFMKGYVGSANIDTNSRLCMSSAVAGHKRAFGEDIVPPCYDDLELADLVVLVGSNTAWCHPILFQRIVAARRARPAMKLVVIDPRRTATCEMADFHLPVASGTDVWLFNGLLCFLAEHGGADPQFITAHTSGLGATLKVARESCADPATVARICQVDETALLAFYRLFLDTPKAVTAFSQGVNQSGAGTDKVNAIINCHLLTGRIGKPGMGPFSLTGQPNAMGGREVGGLANMLAAHMELADAGHRDTVRTFWNSPRIADRAGLKAIELFHAVESGRVKAVWIMATNPVVSLPDADQVRRALERCELVIVSDIVARTDTTMHADILLPALGWGEKDGTVTNSERRISRQRAFLPAPGQARADWAVICDVARRMRFSGFDFADAAAVFDEHARLSAYRNAAPGSARDDAAGVTPRLFDIGALAGMDAADFDRLAPVQWPARRCGAGATGARSHAGVQKAADGPGAAQTSGETGGAGPAGAFERATDSAPAAVAPPAADPARLFSDGRFAHADGRARFIATPPRLPVGMTTTEFPFVMNTGRLRDQWHTMTRTGRSPTLAGHVAEPFVDMHADDALACGVREGELASVRSPLGSVIVRLRQSGAMARGAVFVPIHWNDSVSSNARAGALIEPVLDPVSGQPEFKHTPVAVGAVPVSWQGFILSRTTAVFAERPAEPSGRSSGDSSGRSPGGPSGRPSDGPPDRPLYWTRIAGRQFTRHELAGDEPFEQRRQWTRDLLSMDDPDGDWLEYRDDSAGVYRAVLLVDGRLERCVFLSRQAVLPERDWLAGLFQKERLTAQERSGLLLGQPLAGDGGADAGPTVCSCFGVGSKTICNAIRERKLTSVEAITASVKAGGNCGSCVPELRKLLRAQTVDSPVPATDAGAGADAVASIEQASAVSAG